jgi:hypothetical protein
MKHTVFFTLLICVFAEIHAQTPKVAPIQTIVKSFTITEETKKDLPNGVTLVNNKLVLKNGFSFIKSKNKNAQLLINPKGKAIAQFSCNCSNNGGDGCILKSEDGLTCFGGGCCELIGSPYSIVASQIDVKIKE